MGGLLRLAAGVATAAPGEFASALVEAFGDLEEVLRAGMTSPNIHYSIEG